MSSASPVRRRRSAFATPRTFSPYSTFWATVMWGNSAYSWNTVLTSRVRAGQEVTSTPPSRMVPAVGCSKPAIMRSTVVLPDPDGPRIANSSPSSTVRSAPSTATTPLVPRSWNTLRTPINSICGSPWAVGFVLLLEDGPVDDTVAVPESGPAGMARIVWIGGSNCSPKYGFRMEPVFHRLFPSVGYLGPPSRNFDTSVTSGAGENIEVVVI